MIIIDVVAFYVGMHVLAAVVERLEEDGCSSSEERIITVSAAEYRTEAIHQPRVVGATCTEYTEYGAELTSL